MFGFGEDSLFYVTEKWEYGIRSGKPGNTVIRGPDFRVPTVGSLKVYFVCSDTLWT